MRLRPALFGLLLLCSIQPATAQEALDPSVYDQAWRILRDEFYDRTFRGLDWQTVGDKHRPKALRARTQREVHEAIIDLIGELKSSHGELIEADVFRKFIDAEGKGILIPQYGFTIVRLDEGFFVSGVLTGSSAAAAGLRRGDRLLALDGEPVDEAALQPLPWDVGLGGPRSFRVPCTSEGDQVRLELERHQRPKYGRYAVALQAAPWNMVEATRHSRRVFTRAGVRIGYMRMHHVLCLDVVQFLEEQLAKLEADVFVLDIRGMGGRPELVDQTLNFFDRNALGRPIWDRPVVALIDGSSRSAKEAMAFRWRERKIGPLVGRRTAGAFVGAIFAELKDGARLMVPTMDMRNMTGGVILEQVGVKPDVEVAPADLPWCEGADPVLEKGLDVAAGLGHALRRRGKPHGWR